MRGVIRRKLQLTEARAQQREAEELARKAEKLARQDDLLKELEVAVEALQKLPRLRRQYLALCLYTYRGFTVEEIAEKFSWEKDRVEVWLEAGNSLNKQQTSRNESS